MGVTCDIMIETPEKRKHVTGKPIKGLVKFHLDKDTVYRKISLSLVEKGYCQWDESEQHYRSRHSKQAYQRRKVGNRFVFEGHETKIVKTIHLLKNNADVNTTLTAGSHEHSFEMLIPENIPPSLDIEFGEIKYYLILKFKKPKIFSRNKKFKTKITIFPSIDSSVTDKPLCFALDKTLIKLFSAHKHEIHLKAVLEKGYLNPSSERQISFIVTNTSNVAVSVKTELISKTKYKDDFAIKKFTADDPKTVREVIYSCTVGVPIIPNDNVSSMFVMIPVAPQLCTVRHSKIITREYKLRVTMKVPLPHINSSIEVPVFVGERLTENLDTTKASAPKEEPPAYWECMFEDKV
ncbi:hypothetical protein PYW08_001960 [Mythimna loreyi]|uniref:Uncharacterized protein n=1 Tax=Mythimna loreyi TaxID=667449 RepID=A0ACC2R341_9NEOP|nr:hypothetical protein PYW08_001960 [Mythimna loreyi]